MMATLYSYVAKLATTATCWLPLRGTEAASASEFLKFDAFSLSCDDEHCPTLPNSE